MKRYKIKIEPDALTDIQKITEWYNEKQAGLGVRFQETVVKQMNSLGKEPQVYAIRYREIRCVLIKKFPYMVHFYVNEENGTVEVLAVISTDRNPKIWTEKTNRH
ncbi:MAG: type II toxin-antitoxin system RelE/ParE family toxin [Bacteroidales bacterium]|nr:type II toxin-antitoxin system RelE/ParE family toxin [Bacteroidales bacterium]